MPLKSAIEDLKNTTLRSVEGILARLEYFARRRRPDGTYEHWGLARIHGDTSAQQAMAEAHRAALAGVLRAPLRDLMEDAANRSRETGQPVSEFVEELSANTPQVLPDDLGAGAEGHFRSIVRALSALLRRR
jgi:hypothetical protein